jgi:hypothetical protein
VWIEAWHQEGVKWLETFRCAWSPYVIFDHSVSYFPTVYSKLGLAGLNGLVDGL